MLTQTYHNEHLNKSPHTTHNTKKISSLNPKIKFKNTTLILSQELRSEQISS